RTSPSTFLFLQSSQCQRADPSAQTGHVTLEAELPEFLETKLFVPLPAKLPDLSDFCAARTQCRKALCSAAMTGL
ncbi:hypothetical protein, partial [Devosia sp. MC521]|uniref:hypothetical protein n=1 Tax=Devosia sp. MC521 TaxID=2759954 RepID=UPI001AED442C